MEDTTNNQTEEVKTLLFSQDDTAPDSLRFFEERFLNTFNILLHQWKSEARKYTPDEGYTMIWEKDNIRVCYSADSPYYDVYKLNNK